MLTGGQESAHCLTTYSLSLRVVCPVGPAGPSHRAHAQHVRAQHLVSASPIPVGRTQGPGGRVAGDGSVVMNGSGHTTPTSRPHE